MELYGLSIFLLVALSSFLIEIESMPQMQSYASKLPLSVMSWNVNGLRSLFRHDPQGHILRDLVSRRRVDVLCFQETKLQECHVPEMDLFLKSCLDVSKSIWSCSTARKGYSGTAVLMLNTNKSNECLVGDTVINRVYFGLGDPESDREGRAITIESDMFSLVNVYVPNSGGGLVRLPYRTSTWDRRLAQHIADLKIKTKRPVLLVGDLNVAWSAADYYNSHDPRTRKQPGTTPEEQTSFSDNLLSQGGCGMIDTFRSLHPSVRRFSYFSALLGPAGRQNKNGMRLDYVLLADAASVAGESTAPANRLIEAYIEDDISHPYSDHCPVGAIVDLSLSRSL